MNKRLKDNVSSKYFEAANRLTSKATRRKIIAYVESYDDIFFWRMLLSGLEDDTRYFEVMLPTRVNKLERGKKAVIMNLLSSHVGQDMIACVDADYDYLVQGVTNVSREMLTNRYIFHTYAYAIENLQCYAPSLHDVSVAVTLNDHAIFNFEDFLSQYSEVIYPLFVWNIWYYRSPRYNEFTISDFNKVIELGLFNMQRANDGLANVRHKVGRRVEQLQHHNPNAKDSYARLKAELRELGVTPQTTYLYIQGHHLFDNVVVPMMSKVCEKLVRERENEIYHQSVHSTQMRNELSCYTHSLEDVVSMLKKNFGYLNSEPVKRIKQDLKRLFDEKEDAQENENSAN